MNTRTERQLIENSKLASELVVRNHTRVRQAEQTAELAFEMASYTGRQQQQPHGFHTPGDFLHAVATAARTGRIDERLRPLAAAGSDEQGAYSDPAGGFFVPGSGSPFVLSVESEDDPALGRMLPVPMATPIVHVRARTDKNHTTSISGGLLVSRHLETSTPTPSRGEYEQVRLEANEGYGLTFGTNQIVQDSFPSFTAVLGAAFRDEFAGMFLEERLRGTGTGEMLGILRSPARITIAKESGQLAATILPDNVVKMRARCWGYGQAVWIANHEAMPQIMKLAIAVGTGGSVIPLWRPGDNGWPDTLAGRPLYTSERCSVLGVEGDLICVNWSQYLSGEYRSIQGVSSIHVRFAANETAFRFTVRNDGAPWWRSALTPKNSTVTLSPYVTLAARA